MRLFPLYMFCTFEVILLLKKSMQSSLLVFDITGTMLSGISPNSFSMFWAFAATVQNMAAIIIRYFTGFLIMLRK